MSFLFSSFRNSANTHGQLRWCTLTAKRTVIRIIWPTLIILIILVYIFLTC
ncbi:hypothetical protein LINGRAHAP2_LOCUS28328 [Linum grandiflorum]